MNVPFMWYKKFGRSFFRFITIHAFDRRTDRHFTPVAIAALLVCLSAVIVASGPCYVRRYHRLLLLTASVYSRFHHLLHTALSDMPTCPVSLSRER